MKTYLENVGTENLKIEIDGKEYCISPGEQIVINPIWNEDEQGGESDDGEVK